MVELLKDERKIVKRGDNFVFILNQEQAYSPETREKMMESWEKEIKDKSEWLKNYKVHVKNAVDETKRQLELMKQKIEADVKSAKEALELFKNVEE